MRSTGRAGLPGPPTLPGCTPRSRLQGGPCSLRWTRTQGRHVEGRSADGRALKRKHLLSTAKARPSVLTTSRRKCQFSANVSLILLIFFKEQNRPRAQNFSQEGTITAPLVTARTVTRPGTLCPLADTALSHLGTNPLVHKAR